MWRVRFVAHDQHRFVLQMLFLSQLSVLRGDSSELVDIRCVDDEHCAMNLTDQEKMQKICTVAMCRFKDDTSE